MMRSLGERIVPDTVWLALPCRRFQHCCVWVWKVKEYHSQITPHVKKDMGFKSWQTVQSPCSMAHRLGLCDICRELPWWDDTALHTQGLPAPRNSRWRDPWRRMRDENGNRKWWDYSEYQRKKARGSWRKREWHSFDDNILHWKCTQCTRNTNSESQYITG